MLVEVSLLGGQSCQVCEHTFFQADSTRDKSYKEAEVVCRCNTAGNCEPARKIYM